MKRNIEIAVIPVAGKGTRSYPITKVISKTMFPIVNKPVIHYLLEELISANIKEVIIVLNKSQKDIIKYLKKTPDLISKIKIHYIYQQIPRGIGDALLRCKKIIKQRDFCLLLGDDLICCDNVCYGINYLIEEYIVRNTSILGVKEIQEEETNKYGIVDIVENKVIRVVEKPKVNPPSNKALIGRYIFKNTFYDYLSKVVLDNENEIKITDAINLMSSKENIYIKELNDIRFDIGNIVDYILANIKYLNIDDKLEIKKKLHYLM